MSIDVQFALLAGGKGTRFWPLSNARRPKQFLSLYPGHDSLIEETWKRVSTLSERWPLLLTGEEYVTLSKEQLPTAHILAEPTGRNTAPSIAWASLHCAADSDVLVILPSDHIIRDEEAFRAILADGIRLAHESQVIVTLGIVPESAHTGYGYIHTGAPHAYSGATEAFAVESFREKPDTQTAEGYLATGNYLWNSGMFLFPPKVMIEEFRNYRPEVLEGLERFFAASPDEKGRSFGEIESISIDFAIMEHSQRVCCLPCDAIGWNDIGAWDAWGEELTPDQSGNRVSGESVRIVDSRDNIVSASRPVALLGVENLIVVDTGEEILICERSRCQDVKIFAD